MTAPVFRFAPSPNGYLHLGHAASTLLNFDMARQSGGRFLLRIEDIDLTRCRPAFEAAIYEDLAWLGLSWEEPVRRQSEHFARYEAALDTLRAMGLIYPSFESRAELAKLAEAQNPPRLDPDGVPLYAGAGRTLTPQQRDGMIASGRPYALRLDMAKAMQAAVDRLGGAPLTFAESEAGMSRMTVAAPQDWGDVVLARKDVPTSYHLAVVVDDALQGVSHVVRGRDLFAATGIHRLLQVLLGLPTPIYTHHGLIRDAQGQKLSKSTRATSLRMLRAEGLTPEGVRRMASVPQGETAAPE